MRSQKLRFALNLLFAFALGGCQAWHVPTGAAALDFGTSERKIVKQAENDPFPSPAQVGLK